MEELASLDTDGEHPSDRQLDLDIPRCHQYLDVLASTEGRARLRRLLKAWLVAHPSLEYWQGIDSLAATFLLLNLDNLRESPLFLRSHQPELTPA